MGVVVFGVDFFIWLMWYYWRLFFGVWFWVFLFGGSCWLGVSVSVGWFRVFMVLRVGCVGL